MVFRSHNLFDNPKVRGLSLKGRSQGTREWGRAVSHLKKSQSQPETGEVKPVLFCEVMGVSLSMSLMSLNREERCESQRRQRKVSTEGRESLWNQESGSRVSVQQVS